jgi:hypothetical protein
MLCTPVRRAVALVLALAATLGVGASAAVSAPTAGSSVVAGARAEAIDQTVLPLTIVESRDRQVAAYTRTNCTITSDGLRDAPGNSGLAVLSSAADARDVTYRFVFFSFGALLERLGNRDSNPPPSCQFADAYWNVRLREVVNGQVRIASAQTGLEAIEMHRGDELVLVWQEGSADPPVLDLTPNHDAVKAGESFTVTVRSYASDGSAGTPAEGATVRYGDRVATAGAEGSVTFIAEGRGPVFVEATRAGAIRAAPRPVCAYADDPTVCDLPPAERGEPTPAAGGAGAGTGGTGTGGTGTASGDAFTDRVPPSSRFVRPASGARYRSLRILRGEAAPDRSDIARAYVAVARRVGSRCRFLDRTGRFDATPGSCARPRYLRATGRAYWYLRLDRALAPGRYVAFSRAVDGSGNVEREVIPAISRVAFQVTG